jgi:protein TorT
MSVTKLLTGMVMGLAAFVIVAADTTPAFAENWTIPVVIRDPPLDMTGKQVPGTHTALDPSEVTKKWQLCVSWPHVKDPYYIAVTYGVTQEAKRLGVGLTVVAADGYGDQVGQIKQVEDCVAQGADAVVAIAISQDGLCGTIDEMRKNGVKYIDFGIGVKCEIDGRSVNSYYATGVTTAEYLMNKHPKGSGKVKVLWLPGPAGVFWSEAAVSGFKDTIPGSEVEIAKVMYGDSGKVVQMKLLEDGIQTYPDVEYVVGGAPAIEVAVQLLRELGRNDIGLFTFYLTPGIEQGIANGTVMGSVTESSVMYARLTLDLAVRILEGKAEHIDITTTFGMLDQEMAKDAKYDRTSHLAPDGWKPVFTID